MAGKRRATSELNRDNWDQDEPAEESGVYNKATEEVLKKRVFKTAKRRIAKPPEEGTMNAFNPASLVNLTSKSHQPANQLFSFLSDMKPDVSKTNGVSNKSNIQEGKTESSLPLFSFGNKTDKSEISSISDTRTEKSDQKSNMFSFGDSKKVDNKTSPAFPAFSFGNSGNPLFNQGSKKEEKIVKEDKTSDNVEHYYARLKGLNESVSKWISKHVEDNPLINLQPIFKDYEKFFDEIDKEYHKSDITKYLTETQTETEKSTMKSKLPESTSTPIDTFKFSSSTVDKNAASKKIESTPMFQFGSATMKVDATLPSNTFKFGATNTSNASINKPDQTSFKFEVSSASKVPTDSVPTKTLGANTSGFGGFNFSSNPSMTTPAAKINFGTIPSSTSNNEGNKDEDESEEPPKAEVKEVEEEGQIYTIKCKVFVRKDGNFVERGVGNFFLKPVPDSDKMQVIVRAHNSLANVLCNFILSKSIPTQRMGKNNVMIVCIPTPESKPPPIPVLIKVKTGEDADQLLETLEKHKK